jgi:hypothetical protein
LAIKKYERRALNKVNYQFTNNTKTMKKLAIFLALFFLCGIGYAQQTTNKKTKLSKQEKVNVLAEKRQDRQMQSQQRPAFQTPNDLTKTGGIPLVYVTSLWGDNPGIFETTLENFSGGSKIGDINASVQAIERTSNGEIFAAIWEDGPGWGTNHFGKIDRSGNLTIIAEDVEDIVTLAWNPVTQIMYAVTLWGDFGTVNLTTGAFTEIAALDWWFTLAIDNNGVCYAFEWFEDYFGTLNLTTGTFTSIAELPFAPGDFQGMSFNRETNELYWQTYVEDEIETNFYRVNTATGALTLLGQVAERWFDFVILEKNDVEEGAPMAVTNLIITPDSDGALTALISWISPSLDINGNPLTDFVIYITIDNNNNYPEPIYINSSSPGEADSYTVTVSVADLYTFSIFAVNTGGAGEAATASVWIGPDDTSITERIDLNNPLKAWKQNEKLYISGLTIGERLIIYDISGRSVFQGIANNDVMSIRLQMSGTYIIRQDKNVLRIVY